MEGKILAKETVRPQIFNLKLLITLQNMNISLPVLNKICDKWAEKYVSYTQSTAEIVDTL